jgi:hypothetical protein
MPAARGWLESVTYEDIPAVGEPGSVPTVRTPFLITPLALMLPDHVELFTRRSGPDAYVSRIV